MDNINIFDTIYKYEPFTRYEDLIFLSGQIPKTSNNTILATGTCGLEVDLNTAQKCARLCAQQALLWAKKSLRKDEELQKILKLNIFLATTRKFKYISEVADYSSSIFIKELGKQGIHSRSVIGVSLLPRQSPILLDVVFSVKKIKSQINDKKFT